ncbi:hypothetical protein NON20_03785 [Synechocystis sp. B12]|nr:hypothetical protein NON20_03785 [Synechocystis sp. B12]
MMTWLIIPFLILGLGILVAGAEILVKGASRIALMAGLSPLIIGLTIVATVRVCRKWWLVSKRRSPARPIFPLAMWWAVIFSMCC